MLERRQILGAALGTPAVALLSVSSAVVVAWDSAEWRALGEAVVRSLGPDCASRLLASERGRVNAISDAAQQSSEDYRAGRTVRVEGIIVSRTEAALGLLARERAV
ncbi:MAG: hypothetical protein WCZ66_10565 [Sphingomonadaceae bacterium]